MSPLRALPGRVRTWLRAWQSDSRLQGAPTPGEGPGRARDLSPEFERFMHIGERLERGLEALKDIQWEIRENEARYRDLLDNQADVILRRDAQGRLTFVNQAFCRLFALERATVLGRAFSPRVLAGDRATPLSPGSDAAPAALRAADRDRARAPLVRVGGARGRGRRCRHSRGAMLRPRHHRAAAHGGRAPGGAQAGGSGQPRQVAVPGGHEPRDPHADERHPRHDVAALGYGPLRRAAHLCPRRRALGAHACSR